MCSCERALWVFVHMSMSKCACLYVSYSGGGVHTCNRVIKRL